MRRKNSRRALFLLAIAGGLLLAGWLARAALAVWLADDAQRGSTPVLELPCTQRDLGTVRQGEILRTTFAVTNQGARRLILVEDGKACCGQSGQKRQVILAPGESGQLQVEVNTAQWLGRLEHTVQYTTNDPKRPRFALKVTAMVESAGPP